MNTGTRMLEWYVYCWLLNGVPAYYGKGNGGRWRQHTRGGSAFARRLRTAFLLGESIGVEVRFCESEQQAVRYEAALVRHYGRIGVDRGGILYNQLPGGVGAMSSHGQKAAATRRARRLGIELAPDLFRRSPAG